MPLPEENDSENDIQCDSDTEESDFNVSTPSSDEDIESETEEEVIEESDPEEAIEESSESESEPSVPCKRKKK